MAVEVRVLKETAAGERRVAATPETERQMLVSVGRYALRGVGRSQELFTLDPGMAVPSS